MRLSDWLEHPTAHAALSNIGVSQHHLRPSSIEVVNTTLSISPPPGDPGEWDISVPFDAQCVVFSFRSIHTTESAGGKAGVYGIANRSSIEASTVSLGGHGTLGSTSYNAVYSKAGAALNLSHKVFDSTGNYIALTNAYLTLTGPSTRVLRTVWTNYSASYKTLNAWGEIGVLG